MARHRIEISRTAERQLKRLPPGGRQRVARALAMLAIEPHPCGVRKLSGYDDVFRVRTGRYRIIYSVEKANLIVLGLKIGHRKDVYR